MSGEGSHVATALCAVLERIDSGKSVSTDWLQVNYPESWEAVVEALAVDASLAASRPLDRLDGFRVQRWLGRGGMGTVYLAEPEDPARPDGVRGPVALKIVHSHLAAVPRFVELLRLEAEIGRRVDHANVVRTLGTGRAETPGGLVHYVILEYVEGRTLRALLEELGRAPEDLCRHVARETAEALAAIHAAGAVHRDIKPENILITQGEFLKVTDLGVAHVEFDPDLSSRPGAFAGSIAYAAPEQFTGRRDDIDGRADLYALGVVLHELATGCLPSEDGSSPPPDVSAFLAAVIERLLSPRPSDRFDSAKELITVLAAGEASPWWRRRVSEGRSAAADRRRRGPGDLRGRDAELATLRAARFDAEAGRGRVVVLAGEAGIGKSALVETATAEIDRDAWYVLEGRFPPVAEPQAGDGIVGALRRAYAGESTDERLAAHLAEAPLLLPLAKALLGDGAAPHRVDPPGTDAVASTVVHLVRALAAERPTLLVVEDLHFASDEARELLASVVRVVRGHRALVVATTRPEGLDERVLEAVRAADGVRIELPRLAPSEVTELVYDALGGSHVVEEVAPVVVERSDGNPLFALEILKALQAAGAIRRRLDGGWERTGELDVVPDTLRSLVGARLSALDAEDRGMLTLAAFVGFEFDPGLVAAAMEAAPFKIAGRLAQIASARGLIRPCGPRYAFEHHLVQEHVRESVPEVGRQRIHAAIARSLERGAAVVEGDRAVDLCRHLLAAGDGPAALVLLRPALSHLRRTWRLDESVRLAEAAAAAPDVLVGPARAELLMDVLASLNWRRSAATRLDVARRAVDAADESGDAVLRVRARLELVRWRDTGVDQAALLAACDEAIALARTVEAEELAASVMVERGTMLLAAARLEEGRACLIEARAIGRRLGVRRIDATASVQLGILTVHHGEPNDAVREFEAALAGAVEAEDAVSEVRAMLGLATCHRTMGGLEASLAWADSGAALARRHGLRGLLGMAQGVKGDTLPGLGRHAEAARAFEWEAAIGREIGTPTMEQHAVNGLAQLNLGLGRTGDALRGFEHVIEISLARPYVLAEVAGLTNRAGVLLLLGAASAACSCARDALVRVGPGGPRFMIAEAHRLIGMAAADLGDTETAVRHLDLFVETARALGSFDLMAALGHRARSHAAHDRVAFAVKDLTEAVSIARATGRTTEAAVSIAMLAWVGAVDVDEAVGVVRAAESRLQVHEVLEGHYWLWRATADRVHLDEARRLVDHLRRHAPPEYQRSIVEGVPVHREIFAASEARAT